MESTLVNGFNWSAAKSTLEGFGGTPVNLHVPKTGLPFFDALRLYGAIDLYVGLREDVSIHDVGHEWIIEGRRRTHRVEGRDERTFSSVWKKSKPFSEEFCRLLREAVITGTWPAESYFLEAGKKWDAALQDGIRGIAARSYATLQSGQTSKKECKAYISLSHALLAFAGKTRVEGVGGITFLPLFEGQIDLSKVVSPLRAWIGVPNVLCAQALALLALKTSLFVEGYQERLRGVVFNTAFAGQRSDNYSGLITIASTTIGKMHTASFVAHIYRAFRRLVARAWTRKGRNYQATPLTLDALRMAYWLMQPVGKHLSAMITAQERVQQQKGLQHIFTKDAYVKEVFRMSYGNWGGDFEAVRKFARAVSSAIKWARGRDRNGKWLTNEEQKKNWYDEVTMLRSASSTKAFIERAMILIEQGHREHSEVGTVHREEAYDPQALFASIGSDRGSFETFRDLFRMYLIQESTYRTKEKSVADDETDISADGGENQQEEEEGE